MLIYKYNWYLDIAFVTSKPDLIIDFDNLYVNDSFLFPPPILIFLGHFFLYYCTAGTSYHQYTHIIFSTMLNRNVNSVHYVDPNFKGNAFKVSPLSKFAVDFCRYHLTG